MTAYPLIAPPGFDVLCEAVESGAIDRALADGRITQAQVDALVKPITDLLWAYIVGFTDQFLALMHDPDAPVERIEDALVVLRKLAQAFPQVEPLDELCGVVEHLIADLRGRPLPPI